MAEAFDLEAAQRRLEEKRSSLATDQTKITSLASDESVECGRCHASFIPPVKFPFPHLYRCPECVAFLQEREEQNQQEAREREAVERAQREAQREAEHARLIAERLAHLDIGSRFCGKKWDDYEELNPHAARVKAECRSYAEGFTPGAGKCLLLLGAPGTGKNMLAALIAQDLVRDGHTVLHTTALRMVRRIKESWNNGSMTEQEAIDSFVVPDLLVVDEIGVQHGSKTEELFITEIANDRYLAKKATILISNLCGAEIKGLLGERVIDRLLEDGGKALAFDWPSYRRRQ